MAVPFFVQNVEPDPTTSCGPYRVPEEVGDNEEAGADGEDFFYGGPGNHDTIGMIAMDYLGNIASGTSSNGASFKIPG